MGKYLVAIGIVWVVFSLVIGFVILSSPSAQNQQLSRTEVRQVQYSPPAESVSDQTADTSGSTKTQLRIIGPAATKLNVNVVP